MLVPYIGAYFIEQEVSTKTSTLFGFQPTGTDSVVIYRFLLKQIDYDLHRQYTSPKEVFRFDNILDLNQINPEKKNKRKTFENFTKVPTKIGRLLTSSSSSQQNQCLRHWFSSWSNWL